MPRRSEYTCSRKNCERVSYRVSGGMCLEHLKSTGQFLPPAPNDVVLDFMEPWTSMGFPLSSLIETAGFTSPASMARKLREGRDMSGENFRRLVYRMNPEVSERQPSWRAHRRLCSLRAAGMSMFQIAEEVGKNRSQISVFYREPGRTVSLRIFRMYDAVWKRHYLDVPSEPWRDVADAGWPLPGMWENVDDPYESQGSLGPILVGPYSRREPHGYSLAR